MRLTISIVFIISLLNSFNVFSQNDKFIKAQVIDSLTGRSLAGATVEIVQQAKVLRTDDKGRFSLHVSASKPGLELIVSYLGFQTKSIRLSSSSLSSLTVYLQPAVISTDEVVITGSPGRTNNRKNSLSVAVVGGDKLLQGASNLMDAVAEIPGVSQLSTGGAIAKPVIRGLGYNRVLTIVDGAKEEGQQWGDEHGMQIDQYAAARVEVLKGPASLMYGSDAMGGVLQVIDEPSPAFDRHQASLTSTYQSNNGLFGNSIRLQGNHSGWLYRVRTSYKNAHSFAYKNEFVPNSGFNELDHSLLLGINRSWGNIHLNTSSFSSKIGMVEEGPDADGHFHDEMGSVISHNQARQRRLELPLQQVNHYRTALNSTFQLSRAAQIKANLSYQTNKRKEFEESLDEAGLNLNLDTWSYDIRYLALEGKTWEPSFGLQGMWQNNTNFGEEFLVPDYKSQQIGAFAYLKRDFGKATVNMGLRYDYKNTKGFPLYDEHDHHQHFEAFEHHFSNLSAALGLSYLLNDKLNFKANIGTGFRAPNIAELASNGKHEGTFRYEIGNTQLEQENSIQLDMELAYRSSAFELVLNGFYNHINNYIFPSQQNQETINFVNHHGQSETLPVFRFVQSDARLYGAEAQLNIDLLKQLHFGNSMAWVHGQNLKQHTALPFMPPLNFQHELRYEPLQLQKNKAYIRLKLSNFMAQDRIDLFETTTSAYSLWDAGIGFDLQFEKNRKLQIWLNGQNLADKQYFNHLSRFKQIGVYNPGRNIGLGFRLSI